MTDRPKNVLLIMSDQHRPDTIGAYGNSAISTPHLDRLSQNSAVFERAYCAQPVCSPSRASLFSGVYPHRHGVIENANRLPEDLPTIAELLRPAGYACGYVGKWHLGRERSAQRGFLDYWVSIENAGDHGDGGTIVDPGYTSYHHFLVEHGYVPQDRSRGMPGGKTFGPLAAAKMPEAVCKVAFQAAACRQFLDQHRDHPFFLTLSMREPHGPVYGPFDDMYDPDSIPLPASWYREMEHTTPLGHRVRQAHMRGRDSRFPGQWGRHNAEYGFDSTDPAGLERAWKVVIARYWGLVTLVDRYVGDVLNHLASLGLAEDTIVIYTSDHGDMMGDHYLLNKAISYEGAVRVPLLVSVPSLAPRRVATPVSLVDLAPTLLDVLQLPIPSHLQGASRAPLLNGESLAPDNADVVVEWNGYNSSPKAFSRPARLAESDDEERRLRAVDWRSLQTDRWKLNLHAGGEHEFYDLENDPDELHNAYHDQEVASVVAELDRRLRAWQQRTGDPLVLPSFSVAA